MIRTKSLPLCVSALKALRPSKIVQQNRTYLWRPWWWDAGRVGPVKNIQSQFRDLEREFDRFLTSPRFGSAFFDLTPRRAAADVERFHFEHPIVEEDGMKKFKLVFDASHFNPNEIEIKTKGRRLSISAKHESKDKGHEVKYAYNREYELPEGVKAEDITCKYSDDGHLIVEAPYTPPPAPESKEQTISVKHE